MTFLRRLFGGEGAPVGGEGAPIGGEGAPIGGEGAPVAESFERADTPEDEAARDRELLRAEAIRLDDELIQRQIRYADRAWTPPPQGGSRRAGDAEATEDDRETSEDG